MTFAVFDGDGGVWNVVGEPVGVVYGHRFIECAMPHRGRDRDLGEGESLRTSDRDPIID